MTDKNGSNSIKINFQGIEETIKPIAVTAESTIQDLNSQTFSSNSSFIIHPSSLYVGLSQQPIGKEKKLFKAVVTTIDGKRVSNIPIKLKLISVESKQLIFEENFVCSDQTFSEYLWTPPKDGSYYLTATIFDSFNRKNTSSMTIYISTPIINREKISFINKEVVGLTYKKLNNNSNNNENSLQEITSASPGDSLIIEIKCPEYFNNKRYFRYIVQLCPGAGCGGTNVDSPAVTDIMINWAP